MATSTAESAVRNYLVAMKDPDALRDDKQIAGLEKQLVEAGDELTRLQLRQQILDAQKPQLSVYEEQFITHAKQWADEHGISAEAFASEGVPAPVLRRAGFRTGAGRAGRGRAGAKTPRTAPRSRVTSDEVRAAIPKGEFTIKQLQETSGASPQVVRRVVAEEEKAGRLKNLGPAKNHGGPGRAPVMYRRA